MASTNHVCHAMLVKNRGIQCRCNGKFLNEKDGHYYCGRHFQKSKKESNKEFKTIHIQDCPICLEPMNPTDKTWYSRCNHRFHDKCFRELKENGVVTCPVCEQCILWDFQDDPFAKKVKYDRERYAGFQMWCIQKKMGLKFIKSSEKNSEYCTYSQLSHSLNREMKNIDKMPPEILLDKLMTLCRDYPSAFQ